jgi:hypothetical protein
MRWQMSRLVKRIIGPNPKEAGVSSDELTRDLKLRFARQLRIWIAIGLISAALVVVVVLA